MKLKNAQSLVNQHRIAQAALDEALAAKQAIETVMGSLSKRESDRNSLLLELQSHIQTIEKQLAEAKDKEMQLRNLQFSQAPYLAKLQNQEAICSQRRIKVEWFVHRGLQEAQKRLEEQKVYEAEVDAAVKQVADEMVAKGVVPPKGMTIESFARKLWRQTRNGAREPKPDHVDTMGNERIVVKTLTHG